MLQRLTRHGAVASTRLLPILLGCCRWAEDARDAGCGGQVVQLSNLRAEECASVNQNQHLPVQQSTVP